LQLQAVVVEVEAQPQAQVAQVEAVTVEHGQTLLNQMQVLLVLAVALAVEQHKQQNLAALEL
jgi:hypothetical protein